MDENANEFILLKGIEIYLWWFAHDVTLGAYNPHKFLEIIQTKVIPNFNKQLVHSHGQCPISFFHGSHYVPQHVL
jgi:hypothetical protein